MATPPANQFTISVDELRQRYADDGWADRLQICKNAGRVYTESSPGRGQTISKTLFKYWDENGDVIAVLFRYRRQDGERLSVRMLREGDTVYSGPAVSANPPGL